MSITKFESVIQRYFEKAYVSMLKKGTDYESLDSTPSYVLVDKKRATYYLAESDINDSSSNQEIAQINNRLIKTLTNSVLADPIARLIYSYANLPSDFTLSEIDIDQLSKKAAIITSQDYSDDLKVFLSSINIYFTPVDIKAGYSIHFIDESNILKLSDMFLSDNNISDQDTGLDIDIEENLDTIDDTLTDDTLTDDILIDSNISENQLVNDTDTNFDPAMPEDPSQDIDDINIEPIDLDNILSDLPPLNDDDVFEMEIANSSSPPTDPIDTDLDYYYRNKSIKEEEKTTPLHLK